MRQHDMDGGACLYTVIQWKTAASVLQSGNWVNRTVIYIYISPCGSCMIYVCIHYIYSIGSGI